jgi:hypothetical protein
MWLVLGLVAAAGVLATSVAVAAVGAGRGPQAVTNGGSGMMGGAGVGPRTGRTAGAGSWMMGGSGSGMMGTVWLAGNGTPVTSIAAARDRAGIAASAAGLRPGEVIWFDNGFYVELKDASGNSATEVIVDPASGTVFTEPGPAMMWNTRYGMHPGINGMHGPFGGSGAPPAIDAQRARQIATAWLNANLPGRIAQPPDSYPGYYTTETTTRDGTINGMLSVNASTGQVWYHAWHGRFIAKEDA